MPSAGRTRTVLIAGILLQVVILVSMIALHAAPLVFGETVLLRVVPIDPRDLFRGDYVILGYEFSRATSNQIEALPSAESDWEGRPVFVSLAPEEDGRHWRADRVSVNRPSGGRYIEGVFHRYGVLEFGIEAFYVQEGKGLEYEQAIRDKHLSAEVAVTSRGQAAVRALRLE